jgi:hypothetical protein
MSASAAWRLGESDLIFSGVPPLLTGDVELINESDEKINPKRLETRFDRKQGIHGDLRVPVRLAPHSRTRVRVQFVIDRQTRPGTYWGSVNVGDRATPTTVHVYERVATSVQPSIMRFAGASGDDVELRVSLSNNGNTAHTLNKGGVVQFEEVDWIGRVLVYALRETSRDDGMQSYLDRVVHELVGSMVSTTTIAISAPTSKLEPRDTTQVLLTFTLPAGLIKGRTYGAWLPIAGTRVTLELLCNGAEKSNRRRPR